MIFNTKNARPVALTAGLLAATALAGTASAQDYEVAYLSASSANTWLSRSLEEMEKVAAANGVAITEFDGQFDAAAQTAQLQDVIASGRYDGLIIAALNGPGAVPDIEMAIEEGIEVVVLNQVLGSDLTTSAPQVDGVAASVMVAPYHSGTRLGGITVSACEGIDPCEVVYLYGIKGTPLDTAIRNGFDEATADSPNITVVAEGEGKYLGPDGGIAATQDILQVNASFDVVVGPDQAIQGTEIVLEDEGMLGDVKLIGFGGSAPAFEGIRSGAWYGTVMGAPADEGRLAMEAMVDALKTGNDQGGIDPLAAMPDDGKVTADNVDQFSAQWDG
ncbi:substrate-binding domain-containing protein [Maritimibacter sp. DP07]|uniref:Substrate-binding domain-containing protein n=1 Tax=Maritimibacter harenae TaxID=2606218 RepID=A0A845LXV6_9RHOB|nr:sugar ABC transporter substrate-binding protein [Maritimibacter harenae]MZR11609.1 substrate-binding domain-containing protein [Maritimibacter harenae]